MAEKEKKRRHASQPLDVERVAGAEQQESEIDLLELFYYLLERAKYLVAAAVAGGVVMLLISLLFLTPRYEATSKLYVMARDDSAINLSDLQIGSYLTSDYQEVFKTWEVHEQVLQNSALITPTINSRTC